MNKMDEDKYSWLGGVVVPLVTPLTEDEQLDEAALGKIIHRQLDAGVQALFVLGSAGEGPMLNGQTRHQVIRVTVETVDDQVPVLAGAIDNSVALVLKRLEEMAGMGMKAGVCTLPYYGWYDDTKAAVEFFTTVADKSPIPIIVYNLPRAVGISIKPEITRELYHHPNIAGIKDTNADLEAMEAIAGDPRRPANFKYLFGNSSVACRLFQAGAEGMVCAPANVMPGLAVDLYRRHGQGKVDAARKLSCCLSELCKIFKCPTTCGGIKVALELQGICSRCTVCPWPQAGKQDEEEVSKILSRVKRMYSKVIEKERK